VHRLHDRHSRCGSRFDRLPDRPKTVLTKM
jgi:hypothetical protein